MEMALEIRERHAVVQGMPLVQIGDKHFWFGRPKLVLHLIHFTLFQVSNVSLFDRIVFGRLHAFKLISSSHGNTCSCGTFIGDLSHYWVAYNVYVDVSRHHVDRTCMEQNG